jgi:hypothetical protein
MRMFLGMGAKGVPNEMALWCRCNLADVHAASWLLTDEQLNAMVEWPDVEEWYLDKGCRLVEYGDRLDLAHLCRDGRAYPWTCRCGQSFASAGELQRSVAAVDALRATDHKAWEKQTTAHREKHGGQNLGVTPLLRYPGPLDVVVDLLHAIDLNLLKNAFEWSISRRLDSADKIAAVKDLMEKHNLYCSLETESDAAAQLKFPRNGNDAHAFLGSAVEVVTKINQLLAELVRAARAVTVSSRRGAHTPPPRAPRAQAAPPPAAAPAAPAAKRSKKGHDLPTTFVADARPAEQAAVAAVDDAADRLELFRRLANLSALLKPPKADSGEAPDWKDIATRSVRRPRSSTARCSSSTPTASGTRTSCSASRRASSSSTATCGRSPARATSTWARCSGSACVTGSSSRSRRPSSARARRPACPLARSSSPTRCRSTRRSTACSPSATAARTRGCGPRRGGGGRRGGAGGVGGCAGQLRAAPSARGRARRGWLVGCAAVPAAAGYSLFKQACGPGSRGASRVPDDDSLTAPPRSALALACPRATPSLRLAH